MIDTQLHQHWSGETSKKTFYTTLRWGQSLTYTNARFRAGEPATMQCATSLKLNIRSKLNQKQKLINVMDDNKKTMLQRTKLTYILGAQ